MHNPKKTCKYRKEWIVYMACGKNLGVSMGGSLGEISWGKGKL